MFHDAFVKAFRSQRVYEQDFPEPDVETPWKEIGMPKFSPKNYVERVDIEQKGIASRYVMTFEEQLSVTPFGTLDQVEEAYADKGMDYNDKAKIRRGYEYYTYASGAWQCCFSVVPNLRDIETFANIPGLMSGRIYRSGYPLSEDPIKLVHVLKNILQIRTILDLRGFVPLINTEPSESLSRKVLCTMYRPFVYDMENGHWQCLSKDFDLLCKDRVLNMRKSVVLPEVVQQLEIAAARRSIYCFNVDLPSSDIKTEAWELLDAFPTAKKFFARQLHAHILPLKKDFTEQFHHSGPEKLIMTLLTSGTFYFKAILEMLLWVRPPILICSAYGKDRVGFIFMLLLHIFGADDEAILTDYCASEAGLKPLHCAMEKQLRSRGESSSMRTALPRSGRAILEYIRARYGSLDGYLDLIGFDRSQREALRTRFILPSGRDRLLYKTPPNAPFWTGNPAVLIPKRGDGEAKEIVLFRRTPSMERVLRAVQLLELRDTFEAEQEGPNSAWAIARRRLKKIARTRREALKIETTLNRASAEKLEPVDRLQCPATNVLEARRLTPTIITPSTQLDDWSEEGKEPLDRKTNLLMMAMKTREGLEEILLAKRVVLAKLQVALRELTGMDVVKLLMYRNVQLYADKNRAIKVSAAPELSEVILGQPELFAGRPIRRTADIIKYLHRFLVEESRRLKAPRFEAYRRSTRTSRTTGRASTSTEADFKYAPRFKLIDPEFFFHEIRDGGWRPHFKKSERRGRHRHQMIPKTFAQWLIDCWLLEEGEADLGDPFAVRSDEYFVMPEVLAKYMRLEVYKQNSRGSRFEELTKKESHEKIKQDALSGDADKFTLFDKVEADTSLNGNTKALKRTTPVSIRAECRARGNDFIDVAEILENIPPTSNDLFQGLRHYIEEYVESSREPFVRHERKKKGAGGSLDFLNNVYRYDSDPSSPSLGCDSPRYQSIVVPLKPLFKARFSPFISETAGVGNVWDYPGKGPADRLRYRRWNPLIQLATMLNSEIPELFQHSETQKPVDLENQISRFDFPTETGNPTIYNFCKTQAERRARRQRNLRRQRLEEHRQNREKILRDIRKFVNYAGRFEEDILKPEDLMYRMNQIDARFGVDGVGIGESPTLDDRVMLSNLSLNADTKKPISEVLEARSRFTGQFRTPTLHTKGQPPRNLRPESLLLRMSATIELNGPESDSEGSCFDTDDEHDYIMRRAFRSCDFANPTFDAIQLLRKETIDRGEKFTTAGRAYFVDADVIPRFDRSLRFHPLKIWKGQALSEQLVLRSDALREDSVRLRITPPVDCYFDRT